MLWHPAILSWVPHSKGGRSVPPVVPWDKPDFWYSTLVRLDDDPQWLKGSWSLIVRPKRVWNDGYFWLVEARFLAETAPHDLLLPGTRFDLLEGKKVSAHGMIADPSAVDTLSPDTIEDLLLV